MTPDRACKLRENHEIHMCQVDCVKYPGLLEALSNDPKVICEHCAAMANTGAYVCLPVEL
jgi:hypothetical protein